jgi:hypothetical protein
MNCCVREIWQGNTAQMYPYWYIPYEMLIANNYKYEELLLLRYNTV